MFIGFAPSLRIRVRRSAFRRLLEIGLRLKAELRIYLRYRILPAFATLALATFSARGCQRYFSRSQRPVASNFTPSLSSIRCSLFAARTMRRSGNGPSELITLCKGVWLQSG